MGLLGHEVFVPQSYQFGGEAQVDWYEIRASSTVEAAQDLRVLHAHHGHGRAFHRAYPHATQQAFLEAHELAFAWFGGVFRILRYDNLKQCREEDTARPSTGRDYAVHRFSFALGIRIGVLHAGRGPRERWRRGRRRASSGATILVPVPKRAAIWRS